MRYIIEIMFFFFKKGVLGRWRVATPVHRREYPRSLKAWGHIYGFFFSDPEFSGLLSVLRQMMLSAAGTVNSQTPQFLT